jgi:hypothetical protein
MSGDGNFEFKPIVLHGVAPKAEKVQTPLRPQRIHHGHPSIPPALVGKKEADMPVSLHRKRFPGGSNQAPPGSAA